SCMEDFSVLWIVPLDAQATMPGWASAEAAQLHQVNNVEEAARLLRAEPRAPELIVLVQSRPVEISAESLDRLRSLAPLAKFWRVLGSWCEGEARSGRPPAGCVSTYWHQWPARWSRDLARARGGGTPGWSLPATSSSDERLLADAEQPIAPRSGLVVIRA